MIFLLAEAFCELSRDEKWSAHVCTTELINFEGLAPKATTFDPELQYVAMSTKSLGLLDWAGLHGMLTTA